MSKGATRLAAASGLGCAALALCVPTSATAQQSAAGQQDPAAQRADGGDDAIVVTARRREERLIDVPIAVTSLSGEKLDRMGALDITDVGATVPNVTLEASRATNSTLTAFIRGIGQQDPVSGFEQGVGIYLDDVYLNRPQAAVLDIYDVERIEVLRGPQGTLYGRNTIGGAIKYVTKRLPLDAAMKARATLGTDDQAEGVITASVPLGDRARIGGSAARLSRGGFGENLTLGTENYNKDVWAGRASLEIGGYGEPFFVRLQGDYTRDKSLARGGHRLIEGIASGAPVLQNVFDTRGAINDPRQDVKAYGFSLQAEFNLSDALALRSISAWRKDNSEGPIDFDALPTVDLDVPGAYDNEQLSQEFQLLWDDGGALTALVGFYYLNASADTIFDSRVYTTGLALPPPFGPLPGLTGYTNAAIDTDTYAVFGDFSYDLTEQVSLSVGGRYTWDKRTADIQKQNFIFGGSGYFGDPGLLIGTDTDFQGSEKFSKFTPRASLSFQPTPDHNLYASYSQGFKGGGFDPRGAGANAPAAIPGMPTDAEIVDYLSFEPESVDNYELGYKGRLMDGALTLAAAAFYTDYTNVQIPGSVACVIRGTPTFCGVTSNAGKTTLKGFEFEGSLRFGGGFNLATSLGLIDAKYDQYITNIGGQPVDVAAYRKVQNTPAITGSGTLSYVTDVNGGDLYLGTTLSYRSKTYQFEIPNPYIDQPSYALLDASVVYTLPSRRWTVGLHGKNLLDKEYKTSGYTFIAADAETGAILRNANGGLIPTLGTEGTLTAFYGNPRQVFVTVTFAFD